MTEQLDLIQHHYPLISHRRKGKAEQFKEQVDAVLQCYGRQKNATQRVRGDQNSQFGKSEDQAQPPTRAIVTPPIVWRLK
jgi:hypothetical protein